MKYPMIPQSLGKGIPADYELERYGTTEIRWVSREGEPLAVRAPEETTTIAGFGFTVAGKQYHTLKELCAEPVNDKGLWKDRYGRNVFAFRERFPCFDSSDYLYEDRYYHWYFLLEEGKLHRVHYADSRRPIYVTEDVRYVENKCWQKLLASGLLEA